MDANDQSEPNRGEQRWQGQLRRLRRAVQRKREQSRARAEQRSLMSTERPQDELNQRTKSSGHRKKTADKWNQ